VTTLRKASASSLPASRMFMAVVMAATFLSITYSLLASSSAMRHRPISRIAVASSRMRQKPSARRLPILRC
jgi:hypothetical protein